MGLYWSDGSSRWGDGGVTVMAPEQHKKTPPSCPPQLELGSLLFSQCLASVSILAQAKEHCIMSAHAAVHRNCAEHWTHITAQLDLGHKALNPPVHQLPLGTRLRRHTRAQ